MGSSIPFLVQRLVVFCCERCGEVIHQNIPAVGETYVARYCCGKRYEVATKNDGSFTILAVKEPGEPEDEKKPYTVS